MVSLATSIGREIVNIGISKKGLPICQVVCILDQQRGGQREQLKFKGEIFERKYYN